MDRASMPRRTRTRRTDEPNPGPELELTTWSQGSSSRCRSSAPGSVSYSRSRWRQRGRTSAGVDVQVTFKGLAEDEDDAGEPSDETDTVTKNQLNKKLLDHFRELATSDRDSDQVDLQFLDQMISDGADPNSSDRFGQTVLHEVSRAWTVDVMRFFLDRGADLLRSDHFGVTALHVASALDYEDMVRFLLDRGADPAARTLLDQQTPLHFAAKNDAVGCILLLLQAGASGGATDHRQRTPLQLAASTDRSEAARVLLEMGADAGVQDSDGQLCITALIAHMSPVAQLALCQFQVKDRVSRQQYFYLNLLEPEPQPEPEPGLAGAAVSEPRSPLQVVVQEGKLDLIMNPVFLKLIEVKWKLHGRLGAWLLLALNFLFNISWTTVAISVSVHRESPDRYIFPQDWWRVVLVMLALLLTLEEVFREVQDIFRSRRKLRRWQQWMERRLHDDLRCSHPMWPQERKFLLRQAEDVRRMRGSYSQDRWNIFDWLVYFLLAASFSVHMADVLLPSESLHTVSLRLFSITVIFLWLRLMKHVRAFRLMGPFIVMLGSIVGDVLRFLFLYADIFIPYACSFWIMFGGSPSVPSMQSVSGLLYSLYRITLVDEYEYAAMVTVDAVMAPVLCGTFLAASSILCVNLLVALLTDTFQRVHDNSQAVAVMQQAAVILQVEESMSPLFRFRDNQYLSKHCGPLADALQDPSPGPSLHRGRGGIHAQIRETLDQFLDLQKDMEAVAGSGVQRIQDQQNQQNQTQQNQTQQVQQNQTQQDQTQQDQTQQDQQNQTQQNQQNQTQQNQTQQVQQNQTQQDQTQQDQTQQDQQNQTQQDHQNQTQQDHQNQTQQVHQNQTQQNQTQQDQQNQTQKNQQNQTQQDQQNQTQQDQQNQQNQTQQDQQNQQNQTQQTQQDQQNQTQQNQTQQNQQNQTQQNQQNQTQQDQQNQTQQNQLQAIQAQLKQLHDLVQQLLEKQTDAVV